MSLTSNTHHIHHDMKQILLLISICFAVTFTAACQSKKCYNNHQLSIDLQGDFKKDFVEILLDGQSVFRGNLYTAANGLAERKVIHYPEGTHNIKVLVNNKPLKVEQFSLNRNEYIGVSYYRNTQQVTVSFSDIEFHYALYP